MKTLFLTRNLILCICSALLFSCAQDRNADEAKKQQAQDELAKAKPAEGTYTGVLYDSTGAPLGGLQMVLRSEMGTQSSTDGSGGTAAPTLTGYIDYLNEGTPVSFVTSKSNYDYTTGKYNADVIINTTATTSSTPGSGGSGTVTTSASQQTVSFSGIIHDGKITAG